MKSIKLKSKRLAMILATSLIAGSVSAATTVNVAQKASSLTSSVNPAMLSYLTDNGRTNYWSSDGGDATYGEYQYVEFDWTATCRVDVAYLYWAANTTTVELPTDAYFSYYDGAEWVKLKSINPINSSKVSTDTLGVETSKFRIYMKSDKACGLREVRMLGVANVRPWEPYTWPAYTSKLDYNYKRDYPNGVPAPTKMLPEDNGQVGYKTYGWWAFAWGKNRNQYVTDAAIDSLLKRMDKEFGYFRDSLGWLPDKRARNGYYSTVYLYGSGCYTDNADSTAKGGWQGATWYNGSSWPMVNLSYYPVACFDKKFTYDKFYSAAVNDQASQQSACIHEGIHAVFADLEGCKNSAWFQESGNTSMQADAELSKTPNATPSSMGYLSAGNMIAPFIPIECYSGWLLDGSFGGPSAEGVNLYNSSGNQVCTWRNMLGGYQYGELFAHFLGVRFGNGSLPWIWRYCKDRVLSGIADSLGEAQTRRLVLEYRSKQAMVDFGKWSTASRQLMNDNWLAKWQEEWSPYMKDVDVWTATPYAKMSKCDEVDSAGWWKPEYRTTPGWSGANQIPIHVHGVKGDTLRIHFKPLGTHMVCQLCYRTKRGKVYYSTPCEGEGDVELLLTDTPANKVVMAVVCNTDYIYTGETQRKTHYDYRLQMKDNAYAPCYEQLKWYNYAYTITDKYFNESDYTAVSDVTEDMAEPSSYNMVIGKTEFCAGESIPLEFFGGSDCNTVTLYNVCGGMLRQQIFEENGYFFLPCNLTSGIYILTAVNGNKKDSKKIIIK